MSDGVRTQLPKWFRPSPDALHTVEEALKATKRSVASKARHQNIGADVPQMEELEKLVQNRGALRDFVVRAVLGAIGAVILEAQRDKPVSVMLAVEGHFADGAKSALRQLLPEQLGANQKFLRMLYRDVLHSVDHHDRQIDLGRGKLIMKNEDALQLDLVPLEPTQPGRRVSAKIDVLAP